MSFSVRIAIAISTESLIKFYFIKEYNSILEDFFVKMDLSIKKTWMLKWIQASGLFDFKIS